MLFASDSSGSGSSNPILRAFKLEADTQGTITAAGGENSSRGPLYGVMAVYHRRQADVHLPGHEHTNLSPLSPL